MTSSRPICANCPEPDHPAICHDIRRDGTRGRCLIYLPADARQDAHQCPCTRYEEAIT